MKVIHSRLSEEMIWLTFGDGWVYSPGNLHVSHGLHNEIARGRGGNRPRKNEANSPW
jgi:hypothetical protein